LLKSMAACVAFGFDGAAARSTPRALVTGNPVRAEIEALPAPAARFAGRAGRLRMVVFGGSLGARALNSVLPQALALWPAHERPFFTHQTGSALHAETLAAYAQAGIELVDGVAEVIPFTSDVAGLLANADVVICRAGAITVAELCAAGVPSLLVPLVVSTTAHQRDNALLMQAEGAALNVPQDELTPASLHARLNGLDRPLLLAMAERARALARPHAAARVADEIEQLTERRA
ncbi:MAG TPA: glycosyltransferase, partial [Burkholderiaceae bacterium]